MGNGFRASEGIKMFQDRIRVLPQAADDLKAIAQDGLAWLNKELGDGPFICGDRFTLADVLLYCFLNFGGHVGQPINESHTAVKAWFDRVAARASARAPDFGIRSSASDAAATPLRRPRQPWRRTPVQRRRGCRLRPASHQR